MFPKKIFLNNNFLKKISEKKFLKKNFPPKKCLKKKFPEKKILKKIFPKKNLNPKIWEKVGPKGPTDCSQRLQLSAVGRKKPAVGRQFFLVVNKSDYDSKGYFLSVQVY